MRKLQLLKACIDLFYFFSIIAAVGIAGVFTMIMFGLDIPVAVRRQEIVTSSVGGKILLVFLMASTAFFLYAIYTFRDTIGFLTKRDIFNPSVVKNLNTIGLCIIASSLLTSPPMFFYNMIMRNNVGIEFTVGSFDSLFLSVSLGLFFMVLSEVFKIARGLKEENELTV